MTLKPATYKTLLLTYDLPLLMLLAFIVRIIGFNSMSYTNFPEFYRDYAMVSRIAHGSLILLGPPSMLHGFHFGPFYYYVFLPFFWLFNGQPFSLIFTGIILSVLTVYAFYKLLLLWFNSRLAARVGTLYLSLSVYSLHLSSYVSNPNFLPLFVIWFFYELTLVLSQKAKNQNYLFLGLAFGLATQLHATATVVLTITTMALLFINKYQFKLKAFLIFLLAFIFSYLPYLTYELTHNFGNFRRLFSLGEKNLNGGHFTSGYAAIWNFFQGTLTPFNFPYSYSIIQPNSLYLLVAIAALLAFTVVLYKIYKSKPAPVAALYINPIAWQIIFFWTLTICVTLLMFSRGVHDHYIIILWPVPLLLLTYATIWLKNRFNTFLPIVALMSVISILQIYTFYQMPVTSWQSFYPIYENLYKNNPDISELGS